MKQLWQHSGTAAFWLSYPLLWLYLRFSTRTRALVVARGEVLVVKGWLGGGQWQLPGGGLHRGEPSLTAVIREVKEETGLALQPSQPKLLYRGQHSQYGLRFKYDCYLVELATQPPLKKQPLEITEVAWLPPSKLTSQTATQDTCQAVQTWSQKAGLL